ncbi:MAG: hypothetical protein Q9160_000645 [Pyrenula sp. 1 TL-2023]
MVTSTDFSLSQPSLRPKFPLYTSPEATERYLERCHKLYAWQQCKRPATKGGAVNTFILQDGPPYANGSLHVGHAVNKVIKDVICRAKVAQGMRVDFVPGSDCHGLPIELKVLEKLGLQQEEDPDLDATEIRNAAKSYVNSIVGEHINVFKSWGLMADWAKHWKTMNRDFELRELRVFQAIVKGGLIFRDNRPVYWSPSTHTALAEAELEYQQNSISTGVFVKIPLTVTLRGMTLSAVIWTAEPWTLPANQAIAINQGLQYVIAHSEEHGDLVVAEERFSSLQEYLQEDVKIVGDMPSSILTGSDYYSLPPFSDSAKKHPIIHADFVTATNGTGLVHCAPGHDFEAYQALKYHISAGLVQVKAPMDDFGRFTEAACPSNPSLLQGLSCFEDGNESVVKLLKQENLLLAQHKFERPHSIDWRSREPVMVRSTPQWFLDISAIRPDILAALDRVEFQPPSGKERLLSFVANRNDWCISRQRPWGVPLPAIYHKETCEAVLTDASVDRIIKVIAGRGVDAWWSDPADDPAWFTDDLSPSEYVRGKDTLDVWFDNGSSWSRLVPSLNEELYSSEHHEPPQADVYFEGRDQYRCWFQVSVLTSIAFQKSKYPDRQPHAPFGRSITHGFALDFERRKMSKSLGNIITFEQIIHGLDYDPKLPITETSKQLYLGPDALRLWAASIDWLDDFPIDPRSIATAHEALRKYRLTFRLLLDMLSDFKPTNEVLPIQSLYSTSQVLHHHCAMSRLIAVFNVVKYHLQTSFEIHKAVAAIDAYITQDLLHGLTSDSGLESAEPIILSDTLAIRTSAQITLYHVFTQLQQMLGPIVPLLIEETHDYTPEAIREFAGHPLQRTWEEPPHLEGFHEGKFDSPAEVEGKIGEVKIAEVELLL